MRNQYKVLEEKYTLEVEATTKEKAIYDTTALTQNFIPTATNIYKTQVEPKIKSWPDFDIMTNTNFRHNIINKGAAANSAGLISRFLYKSQGLPPLQPGDLDGILERWFVYRLHLIVYDTRTGNPIDFYKAVKDNQIYPQKSNADFIQYLIDTAVREMEGEYKFYYEKATKSGDLVDWKASQELNQKNAAATGGDWNPQGLV